MPKKRTFDEIFDSVSKQTDEEIIAIELHNDKVRKKKQRQSYFKATAKTVIITAALWFAAASYVQQILSLIIGMTLGIAFRYTARLGYRGHQPHIGFLIVACFATSAILIIAYLMQYLL